MFLFVGTTKKSKQLVSVKPPTEVTQKKKNFQICGGSRLRIPTLEQHTKRRISVDGPRASMINHPVDTSTVQ
jgi:hypothetical protein